MFHRQTEVSVEIVTGEQMRRIDRRAIETLGIPSLDLMESAGRGVAEALLEDYPNASALGVLVLCGKGNNGGDGLVAARHLARRGVVPQVLLLAQASELKGDAASMLAAARQAGLEVHEVPDSSSWRARRAFEAGPTLVLDALLGSGVHGGVHGLLATVIDELNASEARVLSIDLPSGIDADSTRVEGPAVFAERTYTLVRPKLPLVLGKAAAHAGSWRVIPIGIPDEAVSAERVDIEWLDATLARTLLPVRQAESHKGTYGHVLALAGSRGKSGAAVLVARGALRCGAGLVTVATAASSLGHVAAQQAELMTEPLPETAGGGLAAAAAAPALALLASCNALAVGPGLGVDPETRTAVLAVLSKSGVPAVVDADGLNALALEGRPAGFEQRQAGCTLVMTPHPGEAARLLARSTQDVQDDRLSAVRELARRSGAIVVLKGHRSLIAGPEGRVAINSSGNPGMATAGTGDVLTGAIGAFLARGLSGWDAARLAVFVHGDAGDRAARSRGQDGLIASDLVERLPEALRVLRAPEDAGEW